MADNKRPTTIMKAFSALGLKPQAPKEKEEKKKEREKEQKPKAFESA